MPNARKYEFSSYNDILNGKFKDTINIFESKNQFIQLHIKNKSDITYTINFKKLKLEEVEEIFNIYLEKNGLDKKKLKEQKENLYDICKILKKDYKVTYRDLEKVIGVGRETIRRLFI